MKTREDELWVIEYLERGKWYGSIDVFVTKKEANQFIRDNLDMDDRNRVRKYRRVKEAV